MKTDIEIDFDYDFWHPDSAGLERRMREAEQTREQRIRAAYEAVENGAYYEILKLYAKLYLNQDTDEANRELLALLNGDEGLLGKYRFDLYNHWSLLTTPLLYRLYFNFGSRSRRMPGRLRPETERAVLDLLWKQTEAKNDIHLARQSTWWLSGSENHDINMKVSCLLASQIFKQEPGYAARRYPDEGTGGGVGYWFHDKHDHVIGQGPNGRGQFKDSHDYTVEQHYEAWVSYWMEYLRERAKKGFFVEVASPSYMKWTVTFCMTSMITQSMEGLRNKRESF